MLISVCLYSFKDITAEEDVRGQHSQAQGEVRELHQTGMMMAL